MQCLSNFIVVVVVVVVVVIIMHCFVCRFVVITGTGLLWCWVFRQRKTQLVVFHWMAGFRTLGRGMHLLCGFWDP